MLGVFFGIWTWLAFALISSVGYVFCLTAFLLTIAFDSQRRITGWGIRFTGVLMCAAVPVWKFSYLKPVPALPKRCVCVSNHCSNIDPFLLAHLPFEMKYLAKSILFKIPAVGWGIKLAGDIPLVRGSTISVKKAMARAAWYIQRGTPVLIFAEGTRSNTDEMLSFKDGAFRLAIDQQAHVVPIAIGGSRTALKRGDWKPGVSKAASLVGEPISTEGMTRADVKQLKETVRAAIEALRVKLRQEGYA